jgi:hypothetical protein
MDLQSHAVRRLTRIMAWLCLGYIAIVTVGPIWIRPVTGASPQLERLVAFAVVGALFAAAYPRHIVLAAIVVIGAAILLESFQLLEPSRHGRLFDASVKIVGGAIGLGTGWVFARLTRRSI